MARQLAVHSINAKQLDRFHDRISPAGAKDDRRDAEDPEIVALRARTHIAEDLARERNRLANRLREQLWRYYPQFLELSADLTWEWVLELWTRAPTLDKARRLRKTAGRRILKRYRVRAIDADTAMRHLRNPPIPVALGTTKATIAHIESLVPRIANSPTHGATWTTSHRRPSTRPKTRTQSRERKGSVTRRSWPRCQGSAGSSSPRCSQKPANPCDAETTMPCDACAEPPP